MTLDDLHFLLSPAGQALLAEVAATPITPANHLKLAAALRRQTEYAQAVLETALLRQAALQARKIDLADDARLAFFHLDSAIVRRYPARFLRELCETIRPE